ncbi:MAG: family 20 glycosylhydrolase [Phycisphaeraceae bacterium]|nr:family 20 glycosylhydrolase [Phycisphaerae bacterium]MBX3392863.1 family 20 glycosylhydrolase [Phycisphaeraceae bacterium]
MTPPRHGEPPADTPILVPTPRLIRVGRRAVRVGSRGPRLESGPCPPSGYQLIITPDGEEPVRLVSSDAAGRRHAIATLVQLVRWRAGNDAARRVSPDGRLPACELPEILIEDAPRFATRGVMLDVSRDRVPTMRHLLETVDLLGALKFNHLQLYTEHTFAYPGHERAWEGCSPMTPDEIRRLDAYCSQRGIELAANQNCFGHLTRWLSLPAYADLAETHGSWMFDGVWPRSGPFSLCPTDDRSIGFVRDLLSRLRPCFTSPLINIGCDETFDIGYGRSRKACEREGRAAVYTAFVRRICDVVRELGARPMFWADIALSHPERMGDLPEDLVWLAWGYEPDAPFDRWCESVRSAGRPVWVCPGTSAWRSITGRTHERRENLQRAAEAAARGAEGFLVTEWGDTGHHQQWPITAHALAQAAQAAWSAGRDLDTAAASSLHIFGDRTGRVGTWLDEMGDADLVLRETCGRLSRPGAARLGNQTALFIDLLKGADEQRDVGDPAAWERVRERVHGLAERVPSGIGPLIDSELALTADFATLAADRGAWRRQGSGISRERASDVSHRLGLVMEAHRRTWLARCRIGGLESSCEHLRGMIARAGPVG